MKVMRNNKKINQELLKLLSCKKIQREYIAGYDLTVKDLMKRYDKNKHQFFTLVLKQEKIDWEKFENTRFVKTAYETYIAQIRREAVRRMDDKYHQDYQWVHRLINRYYPQKKTGQERWIIEFDNYMESLLQSFYPEALESLLEAWAFDKFTGPIEDFNQQEYLKIINKYKKEFVAYKKALFMPSYEKTYRLNYEVILPDPLGQFNHACPLKQFYFIKTENQLFVATGCSCGSGTRYHHGLFGHYFALLEKQGQPIQSFAGRINKNCQFQIIEKADHLILYGHNLMGNFRINAKSSQKMLTSVRKFFG